MNKYSITQTDCPLVSVIVPVYNVSLCLLRCLNSILQQSYSKFECILIDDGSNDESSSLCDYYTSLDSRFSSIHRTNGGVSHARNTGIDLASGQYIVFCDSDDCLHPDYLNELLQHQVIDVNSFVVCGYNKVFSGSNTIAFIYEDNTRVSCLRLSEYMLLFDKELIQTPYCKVFSSRIIKNHNLRFDTNLSLGEDIVFILTYLGASNPNTITVLNTTLYDYYQDIEGALSARYRSDLLDVYNRIYYDILMYLKCWDYEQKHFDLFYHQRYHHYVIAFHSILSDKNMQTKSDKYRKINSVIKSEEFQTILSYEKTEMNKFIYYAYYCGNYQLVCILEKIAKAKGKLFKFYSCK